MITSVEKAANAMSGKTARACDGCLRRRARWYCAADDAFLCQTCDASVHSANQLARRHDRIRLQMSSSLNTKSVVAGGHLSPAPAWHGRKPRTPRRNNKRVEEESWNYFVMETPVVVPELGSEEGSMDENDFDDQMLCRVPVLEPFDYDQKVEELEGFNEFLPADLDLTEFAADVESLLGGAEMIETAAATYENTIFYEVPVKTEAHHHHDVLVSNVIKTTSTDDSSVMINGKGKEVEEEIKVVIPTSSTCNYNNEEAGHQEEMKREKLLRLNYESVIAAWTGQGSPWTTGTRPEFKWASVCWPELPEYYNPKGGRGDDDEREARVLRYKEKRRTRLFSKKIRYEVRKLNAEKRPRMKGRFVKRTTTSIINGDFTTPFSLYS